MDILVKEHFLYSIYFNISIRIGKQEELFETVTKITDIRHFWIYVIKDTSSNAKKTSRTFDIWQLSGADVQPLYKLTAA